MCDGVWWRACMKFSFFTILFLFLSIGPSWSQCTNGFSLGNDTSICANQSLNLSIANIYDQYTWSNNSSANSLLVSAPGTYYCITSQVSNSNLVTNGSFQFGNTSFTTDYTYYPIADVFGPQASYGIINNANTWFNPFNPCTDHTSGNGLMMVVDGSAFNAGNDAIWCQNIPVQIGVNYRFSYWIQSVTSSNVLANIRVKINGLTVSTQLAPLGACIWQERSFNWLSTFTGNANICLYDLELAGNGNDFALDDISMRQICVYSDTILVSEYLSDTTINQIEICAEDSVFLEGAWRNQNGFYYDLDPTSSCNDIIETELTISSIDTSFASQEICSTDSFFVGGAWQTQAGFYYDFIPGITCNNVLETELVFTALDTIFISQEICPLDSFFVGGAWQSQAGFYYDFVPGITCNNVLETELVFTALDTIFQTQEICPFDSFFVAGSWQTQAGLYYDFLPSSVCVDVRETNLTFSILDTIFQTQEICESDSFFVGGDYQTSPGVYFDLVPGNLCSEIIQTTLVLISSPLADAGADVTAAYEQIVELNAFSALSGVEFQWTSSNDFSDTTQNIQVEVANLVEAFYLEVNQNACTSFDTVIVYGVPLNLSIIVPSAFSPNLDGVNDGFHLLNNDQFESVVIKIYDRWGELIYWGEAQDPVWIGDYSSGENCPIGTYIYFIEASPFGDVASMKLSGTVSLIR